jgi:DNA primase
LSKQEFLNFKEISETVSFEDVLNWLNLPFERKGGELRGDGFIINVGKNLFFSPDNNESKGSVINFVAHNKQIDLRDAASLLKEQFLTKKKETKPKRDIPNLTLEWDEYIQERGITPEISKEYKIGIVKQRSVVAGRIAFKIYDNNAKHIGYIGYRKEDGNWFFPKGFKRPLYNVHKVKDTKSVIVTTDPFDALRIISLGFKQTVSLLAKSMTSEQEQELKKYRYILLFHNEPANIVNRLFESSFINAPVLSKTLKELSDQNILNLIKPSQL